MRNIPGRAAPDDNADVNATPEAQAGARISGGAAGIQSPNEGNPQHMRGALQQSRPGPKVRKYRVRTGGFLMQNNCRVAIRAGKEILDHQYDIEALKRQGIQLDEITEPDPEPVVIPPPVVAPAVVDTVDVTPPATVQDTPEEQEQKRRRGKA